MVGRIGIVRRSEVIARLKKAEPAVRARRGHALYLFGLHARDEAGPDPDIDVFIGKDRSRPFGFDEFLDVYFLLWTTVPFNHRRLRRDRTDTARVHELH